MFGDFVFFIIFFLVMILSFVMLYRSVMDFFDGSVIFLQLSSKVVSVEFFIRNIVFESGFFFIFVDLGLFDFEMVELRYEFFFQQFLQFIFDSFINFEFGKVNLVSNGSLTQFNGVGSKVNIFLF